VSEFLALTTGSDSTRALNRLKHAEYCAAGLAGASLRKNTAACLFTMMMLQAPSRAWFIKRKLPWLICSTTRWGLDVVFEFVGVRVPPTAGSLGAGI
jgi:hypothetical protein